MVSCIINGLAITICKHDYIKNTFRHISNLTKVGRESKILDQKITLNKTKNKKTKKGLSN